MKKALFLLLALIFKCAAEAPPPGVFIIIHGTWAAQTDWCKPGGDFFDTLEKTANRIGHSVICFTWNGSIDYENRIKAARELTKLIRSYPLETRIYLVTHSHGGNVGIVASQLMANDQRNKHSIECFYALATPVNSTSYMPNMKIIKHFYNLFSFEDRVQPCMGLFGRIYPDHQRIANLRLFINDKEPGHAEIHDPLVARWLPLLHDHLCTHQLPGSELFAYKMPGIIYLASGSVPRYAIDTEREKFLVMDERINHMLANVLERKLRSFKET